MHNACSRGLLSLRQCLAGAISRLPPMRKKVFLLYYDQGLPIASIAVDLKRSEGTIKTHLRQAFAFFQVASYILRSVRVFVFS